MECVAQCWRLLVKSVHLDAGIRGPLHKHAMASPSNAASILPLLRRYLALIYQDQLVSEAGGATAALPVLHGPRARAGWPEHPSHAGPSRPWAVCRACGDERRAPAYCLAALWHAMQPCRTRTELSAAPPALLLPAAPTCPAATCCAHLPCCQAVFLLCFCHCQSDEAKKAHWANHVAHDSLDGRNGGAHFGYLAGLVERYGKDGCAVGARLRCACWVGGEDDDAVLWFACRWAALLCSLMPCVLPQHAIVDWPAHAWPNPDACSIADCSCSALRLPRVCAVASFPLLSVMPFPMPPLQHCGHPAV